MQNVKSNLKRTPRAIVLAVAVALAVVVLPASPAGAAQITSSAGNTLLCNIDIGVSSTEDDTPKLRTGDTYELGFRCYHDGVNVEESYVFSGLEITMRTESGGNIGFYCYPSSGGFSTWANTYNTPVSNPFQPAPGQVQGTCDGTIPVNSSGYPSGTGTAVDLMESYGGDTALYEDAFEFSPVHVGLQFKTSAGASVSAANKVSTDSVGVVTKSRIQWWNGADGDAFLPEEWPADWFLEEAPPMYSPCEIWDVSMVWDDDGEVDGAYLPGDAVDLSETIAPGSVALLSFSYYGKPGFAIESFSFGPGDGSSTTTWTPSPTTGVGFVELKEVSFGTGGAEVDPTLLCEMEGGASVNHGLSTFDNGGFIPDQQSLSDCLGNAGIELNPSSWVPALLRGTGCVLRWAFLPTDIDGDDIATAAEDSLFGLPFAGIAVLTGSWDRLASTAGDTGGCEGPGVDLEIPIPGGSGIEVPAHPMTVCDGDGPNAKVAAIVRPITLLGLYLLVVFSMTRLITMTFLHIHISGGESSAETVTTVGGKSGPSIKRTTTRARRLRA